MRKPINPRNLKETKKEGIFLDINTNNLYGKFNCCNCNKEIYRRCYDIKRIKHGSFCSSNCAKTYKQKNNLYKTYEIGKPYDLGDGRVRIFTGKSWSYKIKTHCNFCNKELYREAKSGTLNFCNDYCMRMCKDPKGTKIFETAKSNPLDFAYLLGLIATDGCVIYPQEGKSAVSYNVNISLKMDDSDILKDIQNIFGGYLTESNLSIWTLYNKEFVLWLKEIGITRKKSLTIDINDYFDTLTEDEKKRFVLGCIDGDGSICVRKTKRKQDMYKTEIVSNFYSGSFSFIKTIFDYMQTLIKSNRNIYTSNNKGKTPTYNIGFSHRQTLIILNHLYSIDKNDLFLKRKYEKYRNYVINESNKKSLLKNLGCIPKLLY